MRVEDRLRSSLANNAPRDTEPDEAAWQAILDRLDHRNSRTVQRVVAAVLALAVAASGIGFAVWTLGRNVQRPASVLLPDRIAFVKAGPKSEPGVDNLDLYTVRPDGTGLRNLTDDPAV